MKKACAVGKMRVFPNRQASLHVNGHCVPASASKPGRLRRAGSVGTQRASPDSLQGTSSLPRDAGRQKSKEETHSCIPNPSSVELLAAGYRSAGTCLAHAPDRPEFCLFEPTTAPWRHQGPFVFLFRCLEEISNEISRDHGRF